MRLGSAAIVLAMASLTACKGSEIGSSSRAFQTPQVLVAEPSPAPDQRPAPAALPAPAPVPTPLALTTAEMPLRLATGNGYPPFADQSLPEGGLATALVKQVLDETNTPYTLDWVPWNRAETLGASGRYDAIFPYMKSQERLADFLYSEPLYTVKARVFVRRASTIRLATRADLSGMKLCKPLGYAVEESLRDAIESGDIDVESPVNMEACLRMLKAGRVDGIVDAEHTFWPAAAAVSETARQDFEARGLVIQETTLHLIVSRQNPRAPQIIDSFNQGLRKARRSGAP